MHRGAPTKSELAKRDACITGYKAKGFEIASSVVKGAKISN
jgi:hypothetical protein